LFYRNLELPELDTDHAVIADTELSLRQHLTDAQNNLPSNVFRLLFF